MSWRGDYEISSDPQRLNATAIHAYITRSYWAAGVPLETVARAIRHSLCFGLYHGSEQVGFARVVTDKATFAYLADVYVLEAHRDHGLGKWLIACVLQHADLQGLRRLMLATRDAHGLYSQHGFTPLAHPERLMEIVRPDIYQTARSNNSGHADVDPATGS
jgi:GNAT superfamily N-acetyltransferase